MSLSFDDDEKLLETGQSRRMAKASERDVLSAEAVDAALRSLNIRPTKRRRKAMLSWLAIEGDSG
jgi:hypothetical protein